MRSFMDSNHGHSAQLLAAVLKRDINAVQQFIRRGAKANIKCGIDGHTAVGMAAALGEDEILRLLIQSCDEKPLPTQKCFLETDTVDNTPEGMDELAWDDEFFLDEIDNENSNAESDEYTTLYYYYAKTLEVTGSMLNNIVADIYTKDRRIDDPHVADKDLMTPLHYAASYGHTSCVEILIESGCNLDPDNAEGFTPLHLGTKFYDITLILLKHGADPMWQSLNTHETALHMAVRHRNPQVVELLLKHTPRLIDAANSDDQTPLTCAILADAVDIAMLLLDHKPRINLADKKGRTALYYAVTRNKLDLTRRLLSCRARRLPEHYLLHSCVQQNFKEMVEILIMHGESLNRRNADGLTPIMLAIACRNPEMLEYLLQIVASSNSGNINDFFYLGNELFMAVECTYHLKDFEPLLNVLFTYTKTTYKQYAHENGFVFSCYENYCSTPLAHAIEQNKLLFAEFMIKEGIDASFACTEHSMMHLGQLCDEPGVLDFTRFLVYSGFKFKYRTMPHRFFWTPNEVSFDREVLDMSKNPLPLKALARIVIRRCLTQQPLSISFSHSKPSESFLFHRIKKLGLPKSLQAYLYHFPDCPMNFSIKE